MNQRLIGIYLVIKKLLGSFSLNNFDNRLFLQGTIYYSALIFDFALVGIFAGRTQMLLLNAHSRSIARKK